MKIILAAMCLTLASCEINGEVHQRFSDKDTVKYTDEYRTIHGMKYHLFMTQTGNLSVVNMTVDSLQVKLLTLQIQELSDEK